MYLVSTAKNTILTDFNSLQTKSIYQHSNGESTDFQFYAQQSIFVEVNKNCGLEILRIKEKAQKADIQRVRKLTIDNVYCVACAKQSLEEMAVGLANGQVKLYNYNKSEFIHKFNADLNRNSVLYLDYNASDEYVASVFENGSINVYGHRTKTKVHSFNIDSNSTLARFHPTKRFQLSIASYKGAVTIYDLHSKRKLYHASDAHAAQCRDLWMSPANPDTLISVGYDCVINIFDTRRKVKPVELIHCHPLSTVTASDCGTYFCVGSLKGELTTYDMRNTKMCLVSKKVHDCAVTRVAFVPPAGDSGTSFSSSGIGAENSALALSTDLRKSVSKNVLPTENIRSQRDSFRDFLNSQTNRIQEKILPRRDSFDWDVFSRKPLADENRMSSVGVSPVGAGNTSATQNDSFDNKANSFDILKNIVKTNNVSSNSPLASKLTQIVEEEKDANEAAENSSQNQTSESDKENFISELDFVSRDRKLKSLLDDFKSTSESERMSMENISASTKHSHEGHATSPGIQQRVTQSKNNGCDTDFREAFAELRTEMLQRFNQLESEMKFLAEQNKWQIFTQNFNLWSQRAEQTEEIRDCLGILLQTDPFVNEFLRLKEENELLKTQMQQLVKKE